ncbi:MAG: menaquinone biosynthetic enzyme MqnA/MqnD family protein [Planctomycetota bacterium]|jgi:chorismate dehydratase
MTRKLKIGVVPYLNAKPIIHGLEGPGGKVELVFAVPSKLPRLLEDGEVDVAIVPAVECFRNNRLTVLPGISISSRGPVESVRLFLKKEYVDEVRTVALDDASRTSVALTKVILKEKYGLSPRYISWRVGSRMEDTQADALLVIGDSAMRVGDGLPSLDLGAEWDQLTGLPFVYAVWASTSKEALDEALPLLQEAKERGLEELVTIALKESGILGLEPELCIRYLTECIRYDLGDDEIEGLQLFCDYTSKMGLVPDGAGIDLYGRGNIREGVVRKAD